MPHGSRAVLAAVAVLAVLLAGCSAGVGPGDGPGASGASPTVTRATGSPTPTATGGSPSGTGTDGPPADCPRPLPDPPGTVTERRALSFAERAEANRTYNRICTKREFGLTGGTARPELRVEHRTSDGFYVFVTQPFWYTEVGPEGETSVNADGGSSALYFVGDGTAGRVPLRSGSVWEVDTYGAGEAGRSIRLYNFGAENRNVSLAVRSLNGTTPVTAFEESLRVGGEDGFELRDVVAARAGTAST